MRVSESQKTLRSVITPQHPIARVEAGKDSSILPEEYFHRTVCLERKRAERSGKPFLLMLLDIGNAFPIEKSGKVVQSVLSALALSTRDTDVAGWYKQDTVVGIMFTEIAPDLKKASGGGHASPRTSLACFLRGLD